MGSDKKRKRTAHADDDAEQRPVKAQIIEQETSSTVTASKPTKADGEKRQKKSERKKKKHAVQAKQKSKPVPLLKADTNPAAPDGLANGSDFVSLTGDAPKLKEKKRSPRIIRKEARQKKLDDAKAVEEAEAPAKRPKNEKQGPQDQSANNARFICFVGNLPYTVTTEQIAAHFSSLTPKAIRLQTDKNTGKCKGFAFLEFENYDKMKTCLKLYHHSIFDPEGKEKPGADAGQDHGGKPRGRKINVELTAGGGGGKSEGRRDKIKAKNKKLDEERARDWEKKRLEEAKQSNGRRGKKGASALSGANADEVNAPVANESGIHPSRLGRVMF